MIVKRQPKPKPEPSELRVKQPPPEETRDTPEKRDRRSDSPVENEDCVLVSMPSQALKTIQGLQRKVSYLTEIFNLQL